MSTSSLSPAHFSLLSTVIATVTRTSGLPPVDAEDFSQHVHLALLTRGYAPLHKFEGRSSLKTFIMVLVRRQLLDWRNQRYGKWRPCETARKLGHSAIDLDRLISRDGYSVDEAIAILMTRTTGADATPLRAVAAQLPPRVRVKTVATDDVENLKIEPFKDPVEAWQAEQQALVWRVRLRTACLALPAADRRLLHLRFSRNLAVSEIGDMMCEPAKPLYRRFARILSRLKMSLEITDGETRHRTPRRSEERVGARTQSVPEPQGRTQRERRHRPTRVAPPHAQPASTQAAAR